MKGRQNELQIPKNLIVRVYNGSGNASIEYADRAINNLDNAIGGVGVLYFYEK